MATGMPGIIIIRIITGIIGGTTNLIFMAGPCIITQDM
jgi:hypothetical protein